MSWKLWTSSIRAFDVLREIFFFCHRTPIADGKPVLKTKLSAASGSPAPKHFISTTLTLRGFPESVTLTHGALPTGVTIKFAHNPVTDSRTGTKDLITFSASSTVHVGTYKITIT